MQERWKPWTVWKRWDGAKPWAVSVMALLGPGCGEAPEGESLAQRSLALTQLRIEAESFDRFFESDNFHEGNCGSGPVDGEWTSDEAGGACNIGWTAPGEWLEYDVDIVEGGLFDLVFRVASAQTGRTVHIEIDGQDVSGAIPSPSGGWQSFADRTVSGVSLTAGTHSLRVVFDTGLVNFNFFDVIQTQTSTPQETIFEATFNSGLDGFSYLDDPFRGTNAPSYASGAARNGRLEVDLGGLDNTAVYGMSGGFRRSFSLPEWQEVTVRFDYTLEQSCYYEPDELSQVFGDIDGVALTGSQGYFVAQVSGNGSDCPGVFSSGTFTATYNLGPGSHALTLGAYSNKKTYSDESTTVTIDNVKLSRDAGQCSTPLSSTYSSLCGACGGAIECDGTCSNDIPSNVGAPCGACGGVVECDGSCSKPLSGSCGPAPTAQQRLQACQIDPRVLAGLVSAEICAGADIFFRETFEGNGRTCGSCHPVANNFTIDPDFVQNLQAIAPNDPLFVAQPGTPLEHLETSDLIEHGAILENVDGFQDPENRFVSRSVPHLFSLATSLAADPNDGTSTPPLERTGWGGDGAPGDGSLNAFLQGAITQHFTRRLDRVVGVDFREATQFEKDAVEEFQLSLGRQNEIDLESVVFSNGAANDAKGRFMDPNRGRCGTCHGNAGANFILSGLNRNFNNGVGDGNLTRGRLVDYVGPGEDLILSDGGFGGADLEDPNVNVSGGFSNDSFGIGKFNVPPLIEAADTAPFFHANTRFRANSGSPLDDVILFYGTGSFKPSTGNQEITALFGPSDVNPSDTAGIAEMLVVLNAAFNIDIALQRLEAAHLLADELHEIRGDIQIDLMKLAGEEIEDAIRVLSDENIHETERTQLQAALALVASPDENDPWTFRRADCLAAIASLNGVRAALGSNMDYELGVGTLMY